MWVVRLYIREKGRSQVSSLLELGRMRALFILLLFEGAILVLGDRGRGKTPVISSKQNNDIDENSAQGRVFSLFSIVTFQNQGCSTNLGASGSGAVRNGTCYTTTECQSKGGSAQGNCAAGFGVCCFFSISLAGTLRENCTYIRNPGFPAGSSESTSITYTVSKVSSEVCDLRLDFETFNIRGPTGTDESVAANLACRDTFVVTVSIGSTPLTLMYFDVQAVTSSLQTTSGITTPTICGLNTGEHIYVDLGNSATDTATLTFTFQATTGDTRLWEIKATQVICSSESRPPSGCLQYHTTLTGRLATFNFNQAASTSYMHLQGQSYNICVRPAEGYCCIMYQVCTDTDSFALARKGQTADTADIGTNCSTDYLEIGGGSSTCNTMVAGIYNSRYCGQFLSVASKAAISIPICDCNAPFTVFVKTDTGDDGGAIATTKSQRGVCLEYFQVPCSA